MSSFPPPFNEPEEPPGLRAANIVDVLIDDLQGRADIGDVWRRIDEETQQEIRQEWIRIVVVGL